MNLSTWLMNVFGLIIFLIILFIFHFKIGKYPDPLPSSEHPKKEIKEALLIFSISFIWTTIFGYLLYWPFISNISRDRFIWVLVISLNSTIPSVIIPLYVVLRINKWKVKDLGLTIDLKPKSVTIFAILFGLVSGITRYVLYYFPLERYYIEDNLLTLIILIYACFVEELKYRAILQSKFEKALGQKKSLFYTGILFGLSHLPQELNTFIWGYNGDFIITILLIIINIACITSLGWIFGIIYLKTRSLIPGIICHYFYNWLPVIISLFL